MEPFTVSPIAGALGALVTGVAADADVAAVALPAAVAGGAGCAGGGVALAAEGAAAADAVAAALALGVCAAEAPVVVGDAPLWGGGPGLQLPLAPAHPKAHVTASAVSTVR